MLERIKKVLNNENGSPTVESLVAIVVALCVIIAMIVTGAALMKYIGNATGSVTTLA